MYKQRIGRVNAKTALLVVLISSRRQVPKIGRNLGRNMTLSQLILASFDVLLYLDHCFCGNLKVANRGVPGITREEHQRVDLKSK